MVEGNKVHDSEHAARGVLGPATESSVGNTALKCSALSANSRNSSLIEFGVNHT